MRMTESRLRRIIRSVIAENSFEYDQYSDKTDMKRRRDREYEKRNLPFTKSQEQIQAEDEKEDFDYAVERCAEQLAKLYRSLVKKEQKEFSRDSYNLYRSIVLAAGSYLATEKWSSKTPSSTEMQKDRKELLKVSNMSSFSEYLESDRFWDSVRSIFEIKTMKK